VVGAIDFDDEARCWGVEIDDEALEYGLAPERDAELRRAEGSPERALGLGGREPLESVVVGPAMPQRLAQALGGGSGHVRIDTAEASNPHVSECLGLDARRRSASSLSGRRPAQVRRLPTRIP
jgi:hypothetical protein